MDIYLLVNKAIFDVSVCQFFSNVYACESICLYGLWIGECINIKGVLHVLKVSKCIWLSSSV